MLSDAEFEAQVEALYEYIQNYTRGGRSLEDVIHLLQNPPFGPPPPPGPLAEAERRFRVDTGLIVEYDKIDAIEDREAKEGRWYNGAHFPEAHYWPAVRNQLEKSLGDAVDDVDRASSKVISALRPPGQSEFDVRGLVVGYVQSGKTTNFISVIAKAADVGYRMIIVLAGLTDNLRFQTQERIEQQLTSKTDNWHRMTFLDSDFGDNAQSQIENARTIFKNPNARIIAVVKKNSTILRNVVRFIRATQTEADNIPFLIIDDEADQASINVSSQKKAEVSAINAQIRALLRNKKTAYIAYTATPFANILVNPKDKEDIYPKDFIHVLPKPVGYFGVETIFGREPLFGEDFEERDGLNMIRRIPDEEANFLKPPRGKEPSALWTGEFPPSLRTAILWFILASAERRRRGQENEHSSMLIHTAMKRVAHGEAAKLVEDELINIRAEFKSGGLEKELKDLWYQEQADVNPLDFGRHPASFEDVHPFIGPTLNAVKVIVDNSDSTERLRYPDEEPQTVIAIGGNTLSRGLTLVGLVSSYFVRSATAFDTLSQMGRWFGFRIGYEDLPRIWMTEELESWFRDLALLEADLRLDLSKYAQDELTPLDFQARIRTHPSVAVTSRAKQQAAIVSNPGYSRQRVQTILFRHKDKAWLEANIEATRALVSRLHSGGYRSFVKDTNGTVVFRGVSTDDIVQFLTDYSFYESSILGADGANSLIRYIERERQNASIREWSVSFYGHSKSGGSREDVLGLGHAISAVNRSQLRSSDSNVANIKSLVGSMDRLNDVELEASALKELIEAAPGKGYDDRLIEVRDTQVGPDVGHLTIYLIDKDSKTQQPEGGVWADGRVIQPRNRRKDLEAVEDIIGVGIFFPETNSPQEQAEYIQAPPPDEDVQDSILDAEMFTTPGS